MVRPRRPPLERFLAQIEICESGCWQWKGSLVCYGYGLFWDGEKHKRAHRWAYEFFNHVTLPIYNRNGGYELDHLCRNKGCVNPQHVELVSNYTNLMRGNGVSAQNARKTHCPKGHPYDEKNTYISPVGGRFCKLCRLEHRRQWLVRKKNQNAEDSLNR